MDHFHIRGRRVLQSGDAVTNHTHYLKLSAWDIHAYGAWGYLRLNLQQI